MDDLIQVSVAFNVAKSEPSRQVELTVSADAGSSVNVLTVDQSVLLLKSGNDIDVDKVSPNVLFPSWLGWVGGGVFRKRGPFRWLRN